MTKESIPYHSRPAQLSLSYRTPHIKYVRISADSYKFLRNVALNLKSYGIRSVAEFMERLITLYKKRPELFLYESGGIVKNADFYPALYEFFVTLYRERPDLLKLERRSR